MEEVKENVIVAWTDGSARPSNPGPGGYGIIIPVEGSEEHVTLSKGFYLTTNNRMEMMALLVLLKEFGPNKTFHVYLDSEYVRNGYMFWMRAWAKKKWINTDWKTGAIKPIKNVDLWKELHALSLNNIVRFTKVRAHTGVKYNELADQACGKAAENPTETDTGYKP